MTESVFSLARILQILFRAEIFIRAQLKSAESVACNVHKFNSEAQERYTVRVVYLRNILYVPDTLESTRVCRIYRVCVAYGL